MRHQIGRLAAVAYERGGASSPVALLTSASPQQVLDESAILTQLSIANSAQINQYPGGQPSAAERPASREPGACFDPEPEALTRQADRGAQQAGSSRRRPCLPSWRRRSGRARDLAAEAAGLPRADLDSGPEGRGLRL